MLQQQPRNTLNTRKRNGECFHVCLRAFRVFRGCSCPVQSWLCQAVPREVFRDLIPPTAAGPGERMGYRNTDAPRPPSSVLCPPSSGFCPPLSPLSSLRPPVPQSQRDDRK